MTETSSPVFCAWHPGVETSLRCNRCSKPICAKCAVRTPTGYRCRDCVRGQQKVFDTTRPLDFVFGFITGFLLSMVASLLIVLIGRIAGFFAWLVIAAAAPSAGALIAEALRYVTRRHRSRALFLTILTAVLLGALPVVLYLVITLNFWSLIFQGIYLFIAVPLIYYRLSGIRLSR